MGGMTDAEVLAVLDDEILSLPVMAQMASVDGTHCDAAMAVDRMTKAREAVAALIAERDALLKDAERYRHWRASAVIPGVFGMSADEIDKSIDIAIKAQEAEQSNVRS